MFVFCMTWSSRNVPSLRRNIPRLCLFTFLRILMELIEIIMGVNTWCHSISVTFKFWCWVPRESVLRGSSAHCAKFESHTNRVTFETNAIRMTSSVQAHYHSHMSYLVVGLPYSHSPFLPDKDYMDYRIVKL